LGLAVRPVKELHKSTVPVPVHRFVLLTAVIAVAIAVIVLEPSVAMVSVAALAQDTSAFVVALELAETALEIAELAPSAHLVVQTQMAVAASVAVAEVEAP